jgi:hypothetical protein
LSAGEFGSSFFFSRACDAEIARRPPPKVSRGFFCGASPGVSAVSTGVLPDPSGKDGSSATLSRSRFRPASRGSYSCNTMSEHAEHTS